MFFMKLDRRWRELIILLVLVCVTTPVFWLTNLDREAAALFYQANNGINIWPWHDWWLWHFLFRYTNFFTDIVVISLLISIASGSLFLRYKQLRRPAIYLLLVIALGPGLVVNLIFKDHWGRPRPLQITEFGGQHQYVPPLKIGHTKGKSFTCGHCSVGFMFFALYFLSRKRKVFYFVLTLILGFTLGVTRMSMGGHFMSDILWSGYLVFFVTWLIYYGWYDRVNGNKLPDLSAID